MLSSHFAPFNLAFDLVTFLASPFLIATSIAENKKFLSALNASRATNSTQLLFAAANETRLAILQKKVQIEKYSVEPEVLEYIAKNVDTNIRELEGALKGTYFHSKLFDKPSATLDDAVDTIKETVETTTTNKSSGNVICNIDKKLSLYFFGLIPNCLANILWK